MNQATYGTLSEEDLLGIKALDHKVDIDDTVPDNMVRLAGNRYITKDEFQRQLRREMREVDGRPCKSRGQGPIRVPEAEP